MTAEQPRNRLLGVLFLGVLMGALDIAIVGPALPAIRGAFGVDERAVAWIFSIYVLCNLVSTPLMAKLSDAFGRRSIYLLDVAIFAAGSLLVALAPSFTALLAGRAIQGIGAGGIFPVATAVIGDTFPPEKRGSALGLIGAVFGIAFLVGPIIGGVLLLWSWQLLFLINLPVAAILIVAGQRLLPSTRAAERKPFDLPGMFVLGALLAALAFGLSQIDTANVGASAASLRVWPALLAAAALLPLFWWIERRAADPVLRLSLLGSRQVALAATLAIGAGIGEAAVVFVPNLLTLAFGITESRASFMLLPFVLALAVGSPLAGRLLDRAGSRPVILAGTSLWAAGTLLLGLFPASLALYYAATILIGLGLSALLGAPLRYIMLAESRADERATAQGALTLFTSTGQLLGGALVGALAASRGGGVTGYGIAYLGVGAIALALAILALGLKGHRAELAATRRAAALP